MSYRVRYRGSRDAKTAARWRDAGEPGERPKLPGYPAADLEVEDEDEYVRLIESGLYDLDPNRVGPYWARSAHEHRWELRGRPASEPPAPPSGPSAGEEGNQTPDPPSGPETPPGGSEQGDDA